MLRRGMRDAGGLPIGTEARQKSRRRSAKRCADGGVIGSQHCRLSCAEFDWGPGRIWLIGKQRSGDDHHAGEPTVGVPCDGVSARRLCASSVDGDPARELMDRARMGPRTFAPDSTSRTELSKCGSRTRKKARFTPYAPSVLTQEKAARLISLIPKQAFRTNAVYT
jgi:hypothetical protein